VEIGSSDRMEKFQAQESSFFKNNYEKYPSDNNKTDWIVRLNCARCGRCNSKLDFSNMLFLKCIVAIMELERDENIEFVQREDEIILSKKNVKILKDLLVNKKEIINFNEKFLNNLKSECMNGYDTCSLKKFKEKYNIKTFFSETFFLSYPIEYMAFLKKIKDFLSNNKICEKCLKISPQTINSILIMLENKQIMKEITRREGISPLYNETDSTNVLNNLLLENRERIAYDLKKSTCQLHHVESYKLDKGGMIEISISEIDGKIERIYEVNYHFPFSNDFLNFLIKELERDFEDDQFLLRMQNFEDVLSYVITRAKNKMADCLRSSDQDKYEIVALFISCSVLGIEKLLPLLIDENIEEIFLDSPDMKLYIHHLRYQHCITQIFLRDEEIQTIMSRLRFETNKNLNELSPTLKCVLKNAIFYARFNVDVRPLNPQGFSLDIRRLNKKIFNLIDLINLKTLNVDVAAFLVFCIHSRHNLTVTGRTDSGKTTLLNALDMLYPEHFRKIYVEDEIETMTQDPGRFHQLKFQVQNKQTKSELIKNLLHRSPDVLILGEILTRDETDALFHCLATGMKGLQTIHSNNSRSLLTRFTIHFGIDATCINDLDFIVSLAKSENGERKIVEISEMNYDEREREIKISTITSYNPKNKEWTAINLSSSKRIQDYTKHAGFDVDGIKKYNRKIHLG